MDYIILCQNEEVFMRKKRNFRQYLETRCCDRESFGLAHGFTGYAIKSEMRFKQCIIDDLFEPYDRFMFMTEQQLLEWKESLTGEFGVKIAFIDNLGIEYTMHKDSVSIQKNKGRYGYGLMLNYKDCHFGIMVPYSGAVHSLHTFDDVVDNTVPGSSMVNWGTKIVYKESDSLDASTIKKGTLPNMNMKVKNVIFSGPATIVFWKDGTKTVTKCREGEAYSKEAGLAICFMKKAIGDRTKFQKVMKKWIPEEKPEPSPLKKAADMIVEAMKLGDLESAGKIAEDYKKEENNDGNKTTL